MPCHLFLILLSFFVLPTLSLADALSELVSQIKNENPGLEIGLSVVDMDTSQRLITSDRSLMPASTLKILTTLAALELLGREYTFKTELFLNGGNTTLYVRGHGDPSFTEERLYLLARDISERGVKELDAIVLDSTLFIDERPRQGLNPYQAAHSALPLNFNTVPVRILPGGSVYLTEGATYNVRRDFQVGSGMTSIQLVEEKPAGAGLDCSAVTGIISVQGRLGEEGFTDHVAVANPPANFGCPLIKLLSSRGIKVRRLVSGVVPSELRPAWLLESRPLSQIIYDLNRISSNFIAGQIVYHLGSDSSGGYSFERGVKKMEQFLRSRGLLCPQCQIMDGSGLSRGNRVSTDNLATALMRLHGDFALGADLVASLPRLGESGTLERRKIGDVPGAVMGKTGYIDGVSSIAGFMKTNSGRELAYALILNGVKDRGHDLQNRVIKKLLEVK